MACFVVIDTETNNDGKVMSIGCCIADAKTFQLVDARYYIFPEYSQVGGMYANKLYLETPVAPISCSRREAVPEILAWLDAYRVTSAYAYNASFDRGHLPEFSRLRWYDIMKIAAYRDRNPKLPADAEYGSTGRLKPKYSVEVILRILTGNCGYCETHNAILDAMDELDIMRRIGRAPEAYIPF